MAVLQIMDGNEWQARCMRLLELRYGAGLQRVPDTRLGDLGVEAFTRVNGQVYQCYSAETLDADDLWERQRDKLTREIGKFQQNLADIHGLLACAIGRYVYLVPQMGDRRIVKHAADKTRMLRELKLVELDAGFEITVLTDEAFVPEREELARRGVTIPITPAEADSEKVDSLHSQKTKIGDMERKLESASFTGAARAEMRTEFLRYVVRMQDFVDELHADYPATWGDLIRVRTQREQRLKIETGLSGDTPRVQLQSVIDTLSEELAAVPGLGQSNARDVALGTAGQWLLDCPLDFEVPA